MKPFVLLCTLTGYEISQAFETFEQAFRAHRSHMDAVMNTCSDFDRIDAGVCIVYNDRTTMTAPEVNDWAISTGIMDKVLLEEDALAAKAEAETIMGNYSPEVVADHMYSGV